MEDQNRRAKAAKSVDAKIGLYVHLAVYVLVNAGLIVINLSTSTERLWFKWPLLGWGIGVLLHALAIFVFGFSTKSADHVVLGCPKRSRTRKRK